MANLIQHAKDQVSQLTAQAYAAAAAAGVLPPGVEVKGSVEIPKDPQNGDYASSFAMAGAKAMKMAPRAIAQAIVDHLDLDRPDQAELQCQALWRRFYQTIAIPARHNPKCRMSHMPKRYWDNLPEMQPDPMSTPQ